MNFKCPKSEEKRKGRARGEGTVVYLGPRKGGGAQFLKMSKINQHERGGGMAPPPPQMHPWGRGQGSMPPGPLPTPFGSGCERQRQKYDPIMKHSNVPRRCQSTKKKSRSDVHE